MPRILAVAASDTHLSSDRKLKGDSYFSWGQICQACIEHRVRHLILAGDVLDVWSNGPPAVDEFLGGLLTLDKLGVRCLHVVGQHDMGHAVQGTRYWPDLVESSVHIHRETVDVGGIAVRGIDYQPAGKLQAELDDLPDGVDLLVAHQVWHEFMGDVASPQGSFADVPKVNRLLTGDFHKNLQLETTGKDGQPLTVYSLGSTCMQAVNEPADKYFGLVYDDGTVVRSPLRTRPKLEPPPVLTREGCEQLLKDLPGMLDECEAANADLPGHIRPPVLRVTYHHSVKDAARRVKRLVGARAHVFEKEIPPERSDVARKVKVAPGRALTLEGCLPLVVDEKADPTLYVLAMRALGARPGEAVKELEAWADEYLAAKAGRNVRA